MSPHIRRICESMRSQLGRPVLVNGTVMVLVNFEVRENGSDVASADCSFRLLEPMESSQLELPEPTTQLQLP